MKVKYEEIKIKDIKKGDRIKFDTLENNREVWKVTAVSEHFVFAEIKQFDNDYYTLISKEPIDYHFVRNFMDIPKGSYIRGSAVHYGMVEFGENAYKFLDEIEKQMKENRENKKDKEKRYLGEETTPEEFVSYRNRVSVDKVFINTNPEKVRPPKRYPVPKPYLRSTFRRKDNNYGYIGEPTNLKDIYGNTLYIGDVIEGISTYKDWEDKFFSIKGILYYDSDNDYYGIGNWGRSSNYIDLKRITSYKELKQGDEINRFKAIFETSKNRKNI